MRDTELLNALAKRIQVTLTLLERVHLAAGDLGETVHMGELVAQAFQRGLLAAQFVGLAGEHLEPLGDSLHLARHAGHLLVVIREGGHARFGPRHGVLQALRADVEGIEFGAARVEAGDLIRNRREQLLRVLLERGQVQRRLLPRLGDRVELALGFGGQGRRARNRLLGPGNPLQPVGHRIELGVDRPHHLADAVGLHDGPLHHLMLVLEGLDPLGGLLGQGVEVAEALLVCLAQRLQLLRLGGRALEREAVLGHFAIRAGGIACLLLGARGQAVERLDARVDRVEGASLPLQRTEACGQVIQPFEERGGFAGGLLDLPAGGGEPRAAQ